MTLISPIHAACLAVPSQSRRARVTAIAARMRADPADPYPLDVMAEEAGLSRFQFIRAFRDAMGTTPHAYLLSQRIAQAKRLLGEGEGVASVAAACGFADQSHLTTAFRRLVGLTPAQFARRAARQRAAGATE